MIFGSVRALTSLPYFTADADGNPILKSGFTQGIIDMHTHIGWNFGLARPVNQDRRCPVRYYFPDDGAPIDLTRYSAWDFTPRLHRRCTVETVKPAVTSRGYASTHTAANLQAEMGRLGIMTSAVLAIDLMGSKNSETVLTVARSRHDLIPFVSVDPRDRHKDRLLTGYAAAGARGVKIHPPMQLVRPNSPRIHEVMETAQSLNLPVLFHCGYSPLMPAWQRRYSSMRDFADIVASHRHAPVILGHSGIEAWEDALDIAMKYEHAYLELSGQPPHVIAMFIKRLGSDRLLFGSDWPYYPVALPLAKLLLATDGIPRIRDRILRRNAQRLLDASGRTKT
jgi:predicted TIM-barrel fold metal-dependent hydrolase